MLHNYFLNFNIYLNNPIVVLVLLCLISNFILFCLKNLFSVNKLIYKVIYSSLLFIAFLYLKYIIIPLGLNNLTWVPLILSSIPAVFSNLHYNIINIGDQVESKNFSENHSNNGSTSNQIPNSDPSAPASSSMDSGQGNITHDPNSKDVPLYLLDKVNDTNIRDEIADLREGGHHTIDKGYAEDLVLKSKKCRLIHIQTFMTAAEIKRLVTGQFMDYPEVSFALAKDIIKNLDPDAKDYSYSGWLISRHECLSQDQNTEDELDKIDRFLKRRHIDLEEESKENQKP